MSGKEFLYCIIDRPPPVAGYLQDRGSDVIADVERQGFKTVFPICVVPWFSSILAHEDAYILDVEVLAQIVNGLWRRLSAILG